ncbi:MAG: hypothetical protein B6229_08215 [Spirochaetaceae bacterium 4572_7]|nr:MAG: hypothetical protein B6229_08215 [Spirochaetaceae bacterium 4572_7]
MEELIKNLPLLLENREVILSKPEYYYIKLEETKVGIAYIGFPKNYLYLGELVYLYSNNKFISKCPKCEEDVYITGFGGSPLSGMGSAWGICGSCLEFISGIKPFGTYLGQYLELFKVRDKDNKNSSSMDYHLLEKKLELPENNNNQ